MVSTVSVWAAYRVRMGSDGLATLILVATAVVLGAGLLLGGFAGAPRALNALLAVMSQHRRASSWGVGLTLLGALMGRGMERDLKAAEEARAPRSTRQPPIAPTTAAPAPSIVPTTAERVVVVAPVDAAVVPVDGAAASSPTAGTPSPATLAILVEVDEHNESGGSWDAFDDVDPALCVISETGTRCYPGADRSGTPRQPQCQDARHCFFPSVELPVGEFTLRVIDVDLSNNDPIGEGPCGIGSRCRLGHASVQVGDETTFRAMTAAQHLAAARSALRESAKVDSTEARRQIEAISTEAPERREADGLLREIAREERRVANAAEREARVARAAEAREHARVAAAARIARESGGNEGRQMRQRAMREVAARSGVRMRAAGPNGTTVRIDALVCTREILTRLLSGGSRAELQGAGFRRIECHGGAGVVSEDL